MFDNIFTINPIIEAITGILLFPSPSKIPFIVCVNNEKIILKLAKANNEYPSVALGNSKRNIGFAKKHIPNIQGNDINIVINKEKLIFLIIPSKSFLAFFLEISGINAVEIATLKESGNAINVSTFELSIPYFKIAFSSPIIFFKILTTVPWK